MKHVIVAIAAASTIFITGCTADAYKTISASTVETKALESLKETSPTLKKIECEDNFLKAKVNESITCLATNNDGRTSEVVTTVNIVNEDGSYDLGFYLKPSAPTADSEAAETPKVGSPNSSTTQAPSTVKMFPGKGLATEVAKSIAQQANRPANPTTCPDIPNKVDAKVTCTMTIGGAPYDVFVTVTEVFPDDSIDFYAKVADQPRAA